MKLGEVLQVQSGFAFKKEFFSDSNGTPLVRIRDLAAVATETNYTGPYRDEFLVAPGDFLIGMDGEFRCHIWKGPPALLNQRVCRLRDFSPLIVPMYVYYGIQKYLCNIEAQTAFATVKHISARQIQDIEMPLPFVDEQRRIVDLLSSAENIVRMRREAERKAEEIIPALFLDMFGDPGRNERGWELASLGSLLVDGPKNGLYKHASLYGEGTPILRIDSFYEGTVDDIANLRRVRISEEEKRAFALQPGDIVINRVNSPEYLGKSAIVPTAPEPTVFESNMMRLRLNTEKVLPTYVIQLMQLSSVRRALIANAKHAINQSSINQSDVKSLQLLVPPVALQETFVAQVRALMGLARRQRDASVLAGLAFQSLLSGVFSGGRAP